MDVNAPYFSESCYFYYLHFISGNSRNAPHCADWLCREGCWPRVQILKAERTERGLVLSAVLARAPATGTVPVMCASTVLSRPGSHLPGPCGGDQSQRPCDLQQVCLPV